jgi:hypothetical protein
MASLCTVGWITANLLRISICKCRSWAYHLRHWCCNYYFTVRQHLYESSVCSWPNYCSRYFTVPQHVHLLSKFFSPTYAQVKFLKNNFKIYIKTDIKECTYVLYVHDPANVTFTVPLIIMHTYVHEWWVFYFVEQSGSRRSGGVPWTMWPSVFCCISHLRRVIKFSTNNFSGIFWYVLQNFSYPRRLFYRFISPRFLFRRSYG